MTGAIVALLATSAVLAFLAWGGFALTREREARCTAHPDSIALKVHAGEARGATKMTSRIAALTFVAAVVVAIVKEVA